MKSLKIIAVFTAILLLFCSCGAKPEEKKEPSGTKSTAAEELITSDDAAKIAVDDAKASAPEAVAKALENVLPDMCEVEMSALNGIPIYEVSFETGILELEYEIDSQNGAIRNYKRFFDYEAQPQPLGSESITLEEAGDYAVWYLDLDKDSVSSVTGERYNEFYDAYVLTVSTEEEDILCWIDPYSGILERSSKDVGPYRAEELCYQHLIDAIPEENKDDVANMMLGGMVETITEAKGTSSERQYEVEIKVAGYEYDYTVDGLSGMILSAQCEPDGDYSGEALGGFENGIQIVQPDVPDILLENFETE